MSKLCILAALTIHLVSLAYGQYCELPTEPNVQPHSWESYGPNGPLCGELLGWAMNHACYANGTACGQSCIAGQCFCIYACAPGYCMTQFNPAFDNIDDPSHGVLCQIDGTIKKLYNPDVPLCVPCASVNPATPSLGVVTRDGAPSPATFVSTMTREVPICGLMDPGVDDGLQLGSVSISSAPLYALMFPQWWYLPNIQAQIYIQIPGVPPTDSCVTKRDPLLAAPEGNAGFYQVAFTAGGGMELYNMGGILNYMAFGQISFFGDFGNNNNIDISMCWKFYQEKCIVNYGIRAYVCAQNQSIPSCSLQCELFLGISNVSDNGTQVTICKQIRKCNLATCPDPDQCLGPGDMMGCSPVANIDLGETIVYELFDEMSNQSDTQPQQSSDAAAQVESEPAQDDEQESLWWIVFIVAFVLAIVGVAVFLYYRKKSKEAEEKAYIP